MSDPTIRPIGAELCNTLITEAPALNKELDALRLHFRDLEAVLRVSGPRFAGARRDAIDMHNRAVRRMKGIRDEIRRRETLQVDEDLMEISAR